MLYLTDQPLGPVIFGAVDRISSRQEKDLIGKRVRRTVRCRGKSHRTTRGDQRRGQDDDVSDQSAAVDSVWSE